MKVFISYSRKDPPEWLDGIRTIINELGYTPVCDNDFSGGDDIPSQISKAMEEAKVFLVIASKNYFESEYTNAELNAAFHNDPGEKIRRRILIRLEDCDIPILHGSKKYIDVSDVESSEERNEIISLELQTMWKEEERPANPVIWRLAYSFLRLDQVPEGGWGKSLFPWMEAIWEGDAGSMIRSDDMRKRGGTDFTCVAFQSYSNFIGLTAPAHRTHSKVADRFFEGLVSRIDDDGISTGVSKINIRHTAMGIISLLSCANTFNLVGREQIDNSCQYLIEKLADWKKDTSYPFAMFAALSKLSELIEEPQNAGLFPAELIEELRPAIKGIQRGLTGRSVYDRKPLNTHPEPKCSASPFFVPYGDFWRMERSGFLTYVTLLLNQEGDSLHSHVREDAFLVNRLRDSFKELLIDVAVPFVQANPEASLIRHHKEPWNRVSPRDWGLSAALVALLWKPGIRKILRNEEGLIDRANAAKHSMLDALEHTFADFHKRPHIFKFTQSITFSRYLELAKNVTDDELLKLDYSTEELISGGVTEQRLDRFVGEAVFGEQAAAEEDAKNSVCDLLIAKLQSGEHTDESLICPEDRWDEISRNTVSFYDGESGDRYAERYNEVPVNLVSRLDDFIRERECDLRALDVACGPGNYAKIIKQYGFEVELLDASENMLMKAQKNLGLDSPPEPRDYFKLKEYYKDNQFDLVFASAMMVHIPLRFANEIYKQFFRILKPGGILFVNYKLGDHSLISKGGRFFQYYRNRELPISGLVNAGFRIDEVIERWNHQNLDNLPKEIHWVYLFCTKPENGPSAFSTANS